MRYNYYIVKFKNGFTVFATCGSKKEAEILAQAIMIKQGYDYEIKDITETDDHMDKWNTNFIA